jgi:hypothetical protein
MQSYGGCISGLTGPEVVHALQVTYPLTFLSVSLDTDDDLTLVVLGSANAADCRGWGGIVGLSTVSPGTYYIVVDGFEAGAYEIEVRCFPPPQLTPTASHTPTPTVTATEAGQPTSTPTPTPTASRTPSGPATLYLPVVRRVYPIEFYVNCGSLTGYQDVSGRWWSPDRAYSPGKWGYVGDTTTFGTELDVGNTGDPALYQQQRFAYGSFGYHFDVPNGEYEVTLHFAELWWAGPNRRLFDVSLEGMVVLNEYDVYAAAGGRLRARREEFRVTVSDGQLNITLTRGPADFPIINALSVAME